MVGTPTMDITSKSAGWRIYEAGNLIIGYDEGDDKDMKTGSHNIVVGRDHSYTSYGGLVVGYNNSIIGQYSSVTGGHSNSAEARTASVSGGRYNTAADYYSWVGVVMKTKPMDGTGP